LRRDELAEYCRPALVQQQLYAEFALEQVQHRSRRRHSALAGRPNGDFGYVAMVGTDARRPLLRRDDDRAEILRVERGLGEVDLSAGGQHDIERQPWLAEFLPQPVEEVLGVRIDEFGNAHVPRIAMQVAGADEHGVGDAAQKPHDEAIVDAVAADGAAARLAGYAERHDPVDRLDEVG